MKRRSLLAGVAAVAALAGTFGFAQAQTGPYPNQMVRIVVPFSAGSQTDILARSYGDKLADRWKQQVIIENRPGLAGTASVARSPNDGYTLILISNGHTIVSSLNQNLNFDPIKDFAPVSRVATIPGIYVVTPDNGPKTLKELIDRAKAEPGKLNYASAGLGSASSIGAELLKGAAGVDIVHVPHRGLPESHTSVMRGDAIVFMTFFSAGGDLIQAGKLHPVAVTTAKRLAVLPNVPTAQEAGLAGFAYDPWFGVLAPAGTPQAILDKVSQDLAAVAKLPDINERFTKLGVDLSTSTPAEFDAQIKSDTERFSKIFAKK